MCVDDDRILRDGIALISQQSDMQVVGSASSGRRP
jgi:YesN/AraC family two-component response regulator